MNTTNLLLEVQRTSEGAEDIVQSANIIIQQIIEKGFIPIDVFKFFERSIRIIKVRDKLTSRILRKKLSDVFIKIADIKTSNKSDYHTNRSIKRLEIVLLRYTSNGLYNRNSRSHFIHSKSQKVTRFARKLKKSVLELA